jgi:hypothetical protein
MVCVIVGVNPATMLALVVVPHEDSLPPLPVCLVAVPTGCCVGSDLVSLGTGRSKARRPVGWNAMGHQLFMTTTPAVPVLLVVALTIFSQGNANTASGSE